MPKKGAAPVVPASGQLGALGVEIITQYAGQEQVDLAVLVDVPGSWFGAGADGGLAAAEKKEKYLIDASRRVWAACTFFLYTCFWDEAHFFWHVRFCILAGSLGTIVHFVHS